MNAKCEMQNAKLRNVPAAHEQVFLHFAFCLLHSSPEDTRAR
jgi:hypothetical protein